MESVLEALKNQIVTNVTYLTDSGYIARDPYKLVLADQYPFFNLTPENIEYQEIEDMPVYSMERRIYTINIQFAQRHLEREVATMGDTNTTGLFQIQDDIIAAIHTDRTLGNVVTGKDINSAFISDIVELPDEQGRSIGFVAGGELFVRFFKDVVL